MLQQPIAMTNLHHHKDSNFSNSDNSRSEGDDNSSNVLEEKTKTHQDNNDRSYYVYIQFSG